MIETEKFTLKLEGSLTMLVFSESHIIEIIFINEAKQI